jgi:hypothetical protein
MSEGNRVEKLNFALALATSADADFDTACGSAFGVVSAAHLKKTLLLLFVRFCLGALLLIHVHTFSRRQNPRLVLTRKAGVFAGEMVPLISAKPPHPPVK